MAEQALRGLVARWHEFAAKSGNADWTDGIRRCADELEAALAANPPEQAERHLPVPGPVSDSSIHHGPFPPMAPSAETFDAGAWLDKEFPIGTGGKFSIVDVAARAYAAGKREGQ